MLCDVVSSSRSRIQEIGSAVLDEVPTATAAEALPPRRASGGLDRGKRILFSAWFIPSAAMGVAGLGRIGAPQMWQDELVTVSVANRSLSQIFDLLGRVDAVHGAYYLLMHFWVTLFGDSSTAMRVPAALAMVGAAACTSLIGQRLFGRYAGFAAGATFALVPSMSRYAQEARSNAFVVLFAALSTLLLLRAIERPSWLRWLGYSLTLGALAYLNTVSLAVITGQGIGLLILTWRTREPETTRAKAIIRGPHPARIGAYVLAVAGGAIVAIPVINLGLRQADTQVEWIASKSPWWVWDSMVASRAGAIALLVLALASWMNRRKPAAFATALALVPMFITWLLSQGHIHYFFSKYLLFTIPAWAVLAGAALTAIRWRPAAIIGLALLTGIVGMDQLAVRHGMSHSWYSYPEKRASEPRNYEGIAAIIAKDYQLGDGIVFVRRGDTDWWYMHDQGVKYYLPKRIQMRDVFLAKSAAQAGKLFATECPVAQECVGTEPRLWVVSPFPYQPITAILPVDQRLLLESQYRQVRFESRSGLTIGLLVRVS
jgi:mannosyltransferase